MGILLLLAYYRRRISPYNTMTVTPENIVEQLNGMKKQIPEISSEAEHLCALLNRPEIQSLLAGYEFEKMLGIGGSGAVFQIRDVKTHTSRALKMSRKSAVQLAEIDPENPVRVDLEIEALSLVNHQNITRFFGGTVLEDNNYCLITELVDSPLELDDWVKFKLDSCTGQTSPQQIHTLLCELAEKVCDAAKALWYMHSQLGLYHMDIKPANILINKDGTTYITDLGFARCRAKYQEDETIPVGFTFNYAHPELYTKRKFRVPSSAAKARNQIPARDLSPKFDLYAFGRSLLYLLHMFRERFGDRVASDYCFLYLHLLATLCLGQQNKLVAGSDQQFENEVALGLTENLIALFSFTEFNDIVDRLERLSGKQAIEYAIPELNPWGEKILNEGVGELILTPRVESLINHPAMRRLRTVSQLGLVSEVYPGATHTRHAHTLGVTGLVCLCVTALYHDSENPIFKLLVESHDIEALIVATLLHDVGQTDYGHELEEIDAEIFSHVRVGSNVIGDSHTKDTRGRTIEDIVQGSGDDEWKLDIKLVTSILEGQNPRFTVFKDLLDGPIDADKLDYLQRDGKSCNVTYPRAVDIKRLVRSITVLPVASKDAPKTAKLRLGVKEKGIASTESVLLARQQMYRSVYLHHTVRCLKGMLLSACAISHARLQQELLKGNRDGNLFAKTDLTRLFASHLLGGFQNEETSTSQSKVFSKILKRQNEAHQKSTIGGALSDRGITFFMPFMDERAKHLIDSFAARNLYKRLVERAFSTISEDNADKLRNALSWATREKTTTKVVGALIDAVEKTLQNKQALARSMNEIPSILDEMREIATTRIAVVFDLPLRSLGPGGNPPPVLSDISRKRGVFSGEESYLGIGHIWKEGGRKLMDEISICRVFCEPKFYSIIMSVLGHEAIDSAISSSLPGWSAE